MLARRIALAAAALLFIAAAGAGWYVHAHRAQLELGVGYGARVACACRYVGGRDLQSCYKDFEPGMEPIRLSDDPKTRTVIAWVPLIAKRSVRFDPVLGCQPEPYRGKPYKMRY